MGEIIIKVPGDIKEVFELDLTYSIVYEKIKELKEKETKAKIKELINRTFNTLKENEELEKVLEEEWCNQ
jgi:hypothetical protein